ncbi:MAG: hypothetical protein HN461_13700 [Rhodospirillaceae bacterium]|nr:hypothetical protein [Rhodospirillaceae bacterium]
MSETPLEIPAKRIGREPMFFTDTDHQTYLTDWSTVPYVVEHGIVSDGELGSKDLRLEA